MIGRRWTPDQGDEEFYLSSLKSLNNDVMSRLVIDIGLANQQKRIMHPDNASRASDQACELKTYTRNRRYQIQNSSFTSAGIGNAEVLGQWRLNFLFTDMGSKTA